MFTFSQIVVSRAQFVLEPLDRRRMLSVTAPVELATEVEPTDATDIIVTEDMPVDETVVDDGLILYKGEESDPSTYELEILTLEEPLMNVEDGAPTEEEAPADEDFIRYTLMPGDNYRNLDGEATEEPIENLEDVKPDGILYMNGYEGNPDDVEILVIDEDPAVLEDPNVIYYSMGAPEQQGSDASSTELPPPPAQASGFAPATSAKSLSDDVLGLSDGAVLA